MSLSPAIHSPQQASLPLVLTPSASACYIDLLPNELLIKIILICVSDKDVGVRAVIKCTLLSRHWHELTVGTPEVWTYIHSNHLDWIPIQLTNSHGYPLIVKIHCLPKEAEATVTSGETETDESVKDWDSVAEQGVKDLLTKIAPVLDPEQRIRTRHLHICMRDPSEASSNSFYSLFEAVGLALTAPDWFTLTSLDIDIGGSGNLWDVDMNLSTLLGGASVVLPCLTSLKLNNCSIPSGDLPDLPGLRQLVWEKVPIKSRVTLEGLLNFLRRLPALESLRMKSGAPTFMVKADVNPVNLPHLQELHLDEFYLSDVWEVSVRPLPPVLACAQLVAHLVTPATLAYFAAVPVRVGVVRGPDESYVVPIPKGLAGGDGTCALAISFFNPLLAVLSMRSEPASSERLGADGEYVVGRGGDAGLRIRPPCHKWGPFISKCTCDERLRYLAGYHDPDEFLYLALELDNYDYLLPESMNSDKPPLIPSLERTRLLNNTLFSGTGSILKPRLPLASLRTLCLEGHDAMPQRAFWAPLFDVARRLERIVASEDECVKNVIFALFDDEVDLDSEEGLVTATTASAPCIACPRTSIFEPSLLDLATSLTLDSSPRSNIACSSESVPPRTIRPAAHNLNTAFAHLQFQEFSIEHLKVPQLWEPEDWAIFNGYGFHDPAGSPGMGGGQTRMIRMSAWEMFKTWIEARTARGCRLPSLIHREK